MNRINQSAVRTIPNHAGICRRMTPHPNTPCKFLAAQKKPSSCHICNTATRSTLPRVLPPPLVSALCTQPRQQSWKRHKQSSRIKLRGSCWQSPQEQYSQAITAPSCLTPCIWCLCLLAHYSAWHYRLRSSLRLCVCVAVSVRKAKQVMIHCLPLLQPYQE